MARIPDSNFGKKNVRKPKLEQMETLSFCSVCNPFPQILLLKFQKRGYKLEQMLSFQKQKCRSVSKAMLTLENYFSYQLAGDDVDEKHKTCFRILDMIAT